MKAKGKSKPLVLRSINNVLEFGKHKGKTVQQVMREDSNWLHWALQNILEFKLNRNALLLPPQKKVFINYDQENFETDEYGNEIPNTSYDLP